jgi:hypothetical protein
MAKQRQWVGPAEPAMCAPHRNRQAKLRAIPPGLLRASSLAMWPALFQANSQTKVMMLAQQPVKPPLLGLPARLKD